MNLLRRHFFGKLWGWTSAGALLTTSRIWAEADEKEDKSSATHFKLYPVGKVEKKDDRTYEKTAGKEGPDSISKG